MNTDSLPPSCFCCLLQVDGGDPNELKPQCGWGYNLRGQDIRVRWPRWFADLQHCESGPSWETSSSLEFFFSSKSLLWAGGIAQLYIACLAYKRPWAQFPAPHKQKA